MTAVYCYMQIIQVLRLLTAQITEIRNLNDPICLRDSEISFGVACHGQFVTQSNVHTLTRPGARCHYVCGYAVR